MFKEYIANWKNKSTIKKKNEMTKDERGKEKSSIITSVIIWESENFPSSPNRKAKDSTDNNKHNRGDPVGGSG